MNDCGDMCGGHCAECMGTANKKCPLCGVALNAWTAKWVDNVLVCSMCAVSAKIKKESQPVSKDAVWNQTQGVGTGYYKRLKEGGWKFFRWDGTVSSAGRPKNRAMAENFMELWNKSCGTEYYALLQCSKCHEFHNAQDWVGCVCDSCGGDMVCTKCGVYIKKHGYSFANGPMLCANCYTVKAQAVVGKAKATGVNPSQMQNGDVRKLPKVNSPMWTEQWAVQGSAKAPYVISRKSQGPFGGNVTEDGWACSCPDFTRHAPRTECKHIIRVQKVEGLITVTSKVGANIPASQATAFEKFLRLEKQKKLAIAAEGTDVKMTAFDNTGRKFR